MTEEWRSVPGWDGYYEVSDQGRVRSVERVIMRNNGAQMTIRGRVLKTVYDSSGYPCAALWRDGKQTYRRVSIFVALAFLGPSNERVCRHLNDNKFDNRAENLAWGTQSDNMHDCVANGLHFWANRTACKHGHEYTADNTRLDKRGGRVCRTCARARTQKFYAKEAA